MIHEDDINGKYLYKDDTHAFIWLGADLKNKSGVVQTNQYLIIDKGRGILLDPGGVHLFARVVSVASRYISLDKIDSIFFSHQDPDVSSGIALWLGVTKATIYVSSLWLRFLPHFGIVDSSRVKGIEENQKVIPMASGRKLQCIDAHFLHSTGNFTLYDDVAKILFSADIGAAVFPEDGQYLFVDDFQKHLPLIDGFHKRYMTSGAVCRKWAEKVKSLPLTMIAPQHGAVFTEKTSREFLNWFGNLSCGIDLIDTIYK